MAYQPAPSQYPPPVCCGDEMLPIEARRGWWIFAYAIVIGYLCVWCDREAGPGEPELQALPRWWPPSAPSTNVRPSLPRPSTSFHDKIPL